MYDSTTPEAIPADAEIVAGYVGGLWPTYSRLLTLFPAAVHVSIAINSSENAEVLDVEAGDATPADVPGWVQRQRALGTDPTVYCSRVSMWPAVQQAVANSGITPPHYWIADYTGQPHLVPGSAATQWTDAGRYDISLTTPEWPPIPGPHPLPPLPPPTVYSEDNMICVPVQPFTTDAAGWTAQGFQLPPGKTNADIVSVVCDAASALDPQGWHFCSGAPDFGHQGVIVFKSVMPNDHFTARVFVAE